MNFTRHLLTKIAGPFSPDSKEEANDAALRADAESRDRSRFDKRHGYLGSMAKGMGYGALIAAPSAAIAGGATYASGETKDAGMAAAIPMAIGVLGGGAAGLLHKLLSRGASKVWADGAADFRQQAKKLPTEAQYLSGR